MQRLACLAFLVLLNGHPSGVSVLAAQSIPAREFTELQRLTPSDSAPDDEFGASIAIDRELAIIGAPGGESAYIFMRDHGDNGAWVEVAKLMGTDTAAGDRFGGSVGISGDTVVVGAGRDDVSGESSGSAYIFSREGRDSYSWRQVAKISGAAAGDLFGASVAISGDTVVVGAPGSDVDGAGSGAAYVFVRSHGDGDAWRQVVRLAPTESALAFGNSVAASGSTIVVGAVITDDFTGAAYIFERSRDGTWTESSPLAYTATAGADQCFGHAVAVSGDVVVVGTGCPFRDAPGVAHVFERTRSNRDTWTEVSVLNIGVDITESIRFGSSVAVDGRTAVVGGLGLGEVEPDGAAVFTRQGGDWDESARLIPAGFTENDVFGSVVGISGRRILVGAPGLFASGTRGTVLVYGR